VPDVNEKVVFENIEIVVEAASSRKIEKIHIRRIEPETQEPASSEGTSY
jgi:magnesium and cobalt transporter